MNLAGIYHRIDGVYGYQNQDGSLTVRLKVPKNEFKHINIIYGDRYNWDLVDTKTNQWVWKPAFESLLPKVGADAIYDYYELVLDDGSSEHRYKYIFILEAKTGQKIMYGENILQEINHHPTGAEINNCGFSWGYSDIGKYVSAPAWFKATNWYQIFPDRFYHDQVAWNKNWDLSKKTQGTLQGIINKLDYIQDLGFNGIYLNPIFESHSLHMYDTIDYLKITPSLGTEEDFQNLVQELKKRNMRIILDGVFNHSSTDFFAWQDVLQKRKQSKYKDWYFIMDFENIHHPHNYDPAIFANPKAKPYSTFANTPFMPRFNWSNQELLKYFEKVTKYWTAMGIDGWRLDVADEPSFTFWRKFRKWVLDVNPKAVMVGEVWYDAIIFLHGDQFDSTMNYPLRNIALNFIVNEQDNFQTFKEKYFANKFKYSKHTMDSQFNLLTSHDTARLAFLAKGNVHKLKSAFSWLYLHPGATSFYYGDEYIEHFGDDTPEKGRIPFNWQFSRDSSLYQHIKKMLAFRTKNFQSIMSGISDMQINHDWITIKYGDGFVTEFNYKTGAVK